MITGGDIIIYKWTGTAWTAIAKTRSDELQSQCEMLEKASSTQQKWKEFESGRAEWGLNVGWLITEEADINKVLLVGEKIRIHVGASGGYSGGAGGVTGYLIIQQCKMTMNQGHLATGSFVAKGTGPLEIAEEETTTL